jgi:two-component system response regulator
MPEKSILLVEDNPDDIALTLRAFQKNQILNQIHVASNGVEALDFLHHHDAETEKYVHPLPVIMLLDLKLPKVDGFEVLKRVRTHERTCYLPTIILTSSKEERDLVESYRLGANSYVRKPVSFDDFMQAVKQLGLYWLLLNETVNEAHPM